MRPRSALCLLLFAACGGSASKATVVSPPPPPPPPDPDGTLKQDTTVSEGDPPGDLPTGCGGVDCSGMPTQVPKIELGAPAVGVGLDKDVIRRYIRRNIAKLKLCYEKELAAQPNLMGSVTAAFTIAADGKVTASTATGLANVATCVADVIRAIQFPAPTGGGSLQVSYPFEFTPPGI